MRFENEFYWLLLLLPAFWFLLRRGSKRKVALLGKLIDSNLHQQILPPSARLASHSRSVAQTGLIALLLAMAVLRPQWGFTWKEVTRRGVDIVVAVDVSESMLAEDLKPSRLERARRELVDFISRVQGDRIGLVSFAGVAFREIPLTLDYSMFPLVLNSLNPSLIPVQGTNIEAAIQTSLQLFKTSKLSNQVPSANRERAIILLTDGEDFEGNLEQAASNATALGIRIYIIGIGTEQGAPIPANGGYKRDKDNRVVISRMKRENLALLAERTGGVFVTSVASDEDAQTIYDRGLKQALQDSEIDNVRTKKWNEYYQLPLALGILLLLLRALKFSSRATSFIFFSILLLSTSPKSAQAQASESLGKKARDAYQQGDFEVAKELIEKAAPQNIEDPRFSLTHGSALYRLNDFENAQAAFFDAASKTEMKDAKAHALYNAANSLVQLGSYKEAINTYNQVLELTPGDEDAKHNLEYVKKLLQSQSEQEKSENEQKESKPQDQEKSPSKQEPQDSKQEPEQQDSKQQQEPQNPEEEKSEQNNKQPKQEQSNENSEAPASPEQQPEPQQQPEYDPQSSLLDSVEEKRDARADHRKAQAMEQLKRENRPLPEKNW